MAQGWRIDHVPTGGRTTAAEKHLLLTWLAGVGLAGTSYWNKVEHTQRDPLHTSSDPFVYILNSLTYSDGNARPDLGVDMRCWAEYRMCLWDGHVNGMRCLQPHRISLHSALTV